jgi:Gas vesicle protein K
MTDDRLERVLHGPADVTSLTRDLEAVAAGLPTRLDADPERVERGLAQLVLTLIELLRQLMERQALRRMESGTLTDEEIERMGVTFMRLEQRMEELKVQFGLGDEDLNLNLGPLGDLL